MTESELLELGKRLERVERSVRRYRAALGIAGLLLAGCLLIAAGLFATGHARAATSAPAQIVARSFVLVDANGRPRAILGFGPHGLALALFDKAGKERVALVTDKGPGLVLYDEAGNMRVALAMMKDAPALALYDEAGKIRVSLDIAADAPALALYDSAEKARAALDIAGDAPALSLYDKAGTARAALDIGNHGPSLLLRDKAGNDRAALGTVSLDNEATGSTETRAESSLVLFNERGRVLWEAP